MQVVAKLSSETGRPTISQKDKNQNIKKCKGSPSKSSNKTFVDDEKAVGKKNLKSSHGHVATVPSDPKNGRSKSSQFNRGFWSSARTKANNPASQTQSD